MDSKSQSPPVYTVFLAPAAERQLKRLNDPFKTQVLRRIEKLADDPRPPGIEKLTGSEDGIYRIHSGNYRILYTINDDKLVVLVIKIGDRKDVYRRLPKAR